MLPFMLMVKISGASYNYVDNKTKFLEYEMI